EEDETEETIGVTSVNPADETADDSLSPEETEDDIVESSEDIVESSEDSVESSEDIAESSEDIVEASSTSPVEESDETVEIAESSDSIVASPSEIEKVFDAAIASPSELEAELVLEEALMGAATHSGYTQQATTYFAGNKTLTANSYLAGNTTFSSGTISVTSNIEICMHEKNFTLSGGKFSVSEGKTLTITNCGSSGVLSINGTTFATGKGKIVIKGVKINTTATLNFNASNVDFVQCTFNSINASDYFVKATNSSKVNFERMNFNGLSKGFYYNNSEGLFYGVSIKNSTVDTLFRVENQAKVTLKFYMTSSGYVSCIYEGNKNIALVDNAKFFVSGGLTAEAQTDIIKMNYDGTKSIRQNKYGRSANKSEIKLLDTKDNPINLDKMPKVLFRNNNGNYLFAAKNNSSIGFDGIAVHNNFTKTSDGKMGVYVNLGGKNTLGLHTQPYVNQNTRNIVVTSDDTITAEPFEYGYVTGKPLSVSSSLSFYLTDKSPRKLLEKVHSADYTNPKDGNLSQTFFDITMEDGKIVKDLNPVIMIEGYKDDLFNYYGDDYAGTNMRVYYEYDKSESFYHFYVEPYEEKDEITVKLKANGGSFKDPKGNDIVTDYTFTYDRNNPDEDLKNWFKSLVPTSKDSIDNYPGEFKGWSKFQDTQSFMTVDEILAFESDITLYAHFYYPDLYKFVFQAEKNGANKLRGIAYESFEEKTVYVRMTKSAGSSGDLPVPKIDIELINGFKLKEDNVGKKWTAADQENAQYKYLYENRTEPINNHDVKTFYYYLEYEEPELEVKINANGGTFTDYEGNTVTDSYTFKYKKYSSPESLVNWFKNLTLTKVEEIDGYEITSKNLVDANDSSKVYTVNDILEMTESVEVKFQYKVPLLYTFNFTAEEGGKSELKGKAYDEATFDPVYVRIDKNEYTQGVITAPSYADLPKNGYKAGAKWISETGKALSPDNITTFDKIDDADMTFNYYLVWTEPSINVTINANGAEFTDPNGNKVTDEYSFTYKKFSPDEKIANWFKNLTAKAIDSKDNYEVTVKGFAKAPKSTELVNLEAVLDGLENTTLYAIYEFPTLYTYNFTAEKGNNIV
ncbi:MAG: hypothetical protein II411_04760, partial [Lachnospiraceae bacterium]|nr:hypothetical protein [Lachnospiraceae bacterium]